MDAGGTSVRRLLILVPLLWLVAAAFLANAWVLGIGLLIPGLLILSLCFRQARRKAWGAVAAWAACSLFPLGCLALVALANVHLHDFTGGGSGCDYMAQNCDPQVAQGLVHVLSLAACGATAIATLRLITASQRNVHAVDPCDP